MEEERMEIIMDPSAEPMTSEQFAAIVAEEKKREKESKEPEGLLGKIIDCVRTVYSNNTF